MEIGDCTLPVTADGQMADAGGKPLRLYRGTVAGEDDVGGICPVTGRRLDVMWFTSCPENAEFFADGEIQCCLVMLMHPIVFRPGHAPVYGPGPYVTSLGIDPRDGFAGERDPAPDGVAFLDVVDGSHPSDVYAVFPRDGSVRHAVQVIGRKTYDDDGTAVYSGEVCAAWRATSVAA